MKIAPSRPAKLAAPLYFIVLDGVSAAITQYTPLSTPFPPPLRDLQHPLPASHTARSQQWLLPPAIF